MKGLVFCLVFWWFLLIFVGVVSYYLLDKLVIYYLVDDFIGFEMFYFLDSVGFVGCIYLVFFNF